MDRIVSALPQPKSKRPATTVKKEGEEGKTLEKGKMTASITGPLGVGGALTVKMPKNETHEQAISQAVSWNNF